MRGFTLGGGLGRVNRKIGLAIDNLPGAELVTADGSIGGAVARVPPQATAYFHREAHSNIGISANVRPDANDRAARETTS